MEINTWQSPAIAPVIGMPIDGPTSRPAQTRPCGAPAGGALGRLVTGMADVRVDAVRIKNHFPGSHAWSPPLS